MRRLFLAALLCAGPIQGALAQTPTDAERAFAATNLLGASVSRELEASGRVLAATNALAACGTDLKRAQAGVKDLQDALNKLREEAAKPATPGPAPETNH